MSLRFMCFRSIGLGFISLGFMGLRSMCFGFGIYRFVYGLRFRYLRPIGVDFIGLGFMGLGVFGLEFMGLRSIGLDFILGLWVWGFMFRVYGLMIEFYTFGVCWFTGM